MKTILCFGDSNTWGAIPNGCQRYSEQERWTKRLAAQLPDDYDVIEAGLPGRTTVFDDPIEGDKNGLKHLPVYLSSCLPDLVLILLGTNDLKHRFQATPFDVSMGAANLVRCVQAFHHPSKKRAPSVLLMTPPPIREIGYCADMFLGGEQKSTALAKQFAKRANECGCALLDVAEVVGSSPKDGIHWSASEHQSLATALVPWVHQLLT